VDALPRQHTAFGVAAPGAMLASVSVCNSPRCHVHVPMKTLARICAHLSWILCLARLPIVAGRDFNDSTAKERPVVIAVSPEAMLSAAVRAIPARVCGIGREDVSGHRAVTPRRHLQFDHAWRGTPRHRWPRAHGAFIAEDLDNRSSAVDDLGRILNPATAFT